MKRNWKPVRRGETYCSPACGFGCLWTSYVNAKKRGKELAKRMGKGWKAQYWENGAWHFCAISPCGRIKVHAGYTAFLGEPESGGGQWAESGKTPERAVKKVIKTAKLSLAGIGAIIKGL